MSDAGRRAWKLQSGDGYVQVLLDGRKLSVYDPSQQTVYRATLPDGLPQEPAGRARSDGPTDRGLAGLLMQGADLLGSHPGVVAASRPHVKISPKHDGGLLGRAELRLGRHARRPPAGGGYAAGTPRRSSS